MIETQGAAAVMPAPDGPANVLVVTRDAATRDEVAAAVTACCERRPAVWAATDGDAASAALASPRTEPLSLVIVDRASVTPGEVERCRRQLPTGARLVLLLGQWEPMDSVAAIVHGVMRKPLDPDRLRNLACPLP